MLWNGSLKQPQTKYSRIIYNLEQNVIWNGSLKQPQTTIIKVFLKDPWRNPSLHEGKTVYLKNKIILS